MNPLGELLVIAVLILLNAFFVAAEIALVSLRRSRVEQLVEEGRPGAGRLQRLLEQPGRFLAVVQVGVTFVGFLASAFAAVSLTIHLQHAFERIAPLHAYAGAIALLVVTAAIALLTIIFGELVPKSVALAYTERTALTVAGPIELLSRLLRPLIAFLAWTTERVSRLFGVRSLTPASISVEELKILVERGGEEGVLEAEEEQMISAVIELGEGRVHEVMVPRIDITAVPATSTLDEAIDVIVQAGHSRIPVFEETIDNINGILYAKDLLPYLKAGGQRPELRELLRAPLFVPESMSIDDLLHELQRRKVHIAIVLDEYGGTAGLVTIEDLIEEIVGEIQDEYDVEEPMVVRLSEDEARLDGRASIDDLLELFDLTLDEEEREEYDTVGGLVYHRIGGVPVVGAAVDLGKVSLTVESTDGRRVGKVLAVRRSQEAEDKGEARDSVA